MLRRLAISEDHVASVRKSAPSKGKLMFSKFFQSEHYHLICFPSVTFFSPFLFGKSRYILWETVFFYLGLFKFFKTNMSTTATTKAKQEKPWILFARICLYLHEYFVIFFPWTFPFLENFFFLLFWRTICIVIGIYPNFKLERENYNYVCWWYTLDLQLSKRLGRISDNLQF